MIYRLKIYIRFIFHSFFIRLSFNRSVHHYKSFVAEVAKKKESILPEVKWFDINEIKNKKRSRKIFILGSGQSISNLNENDWDVINKNDSLSLNFNVMLEHIPTYLMFEMPRDLDRKLVFLEWLNNRADSYNENKTALILRSFNSVNFSEADLANELKELCYITEQIPLSSPSKRSLRKCLNILDEFLESHPRCVPSYKASLFTACHLAASLGYEEILLVGFDLNNTKYFYEDPSFKSTPIPSSGQEGPVHKTAQSTILSLSIADALSALNESYIKSRGVKLYVTSPNSLLAKHIEVKKIEDSL